MCSFKRCCYPVRRRRDRFAPKRDPRTDALPPLDARIIQRALNFCLLRNWEKAVRRLTHPQRAAQQKNRPAMPTPCSTPSPPLSFRAVEWMKRQAKANWAVCFLLQGMHDMFISPQHSGTTSSSGASIISAAGTSGSSSASGGLHHHQQYQQQQPQKKRKLEHGYVEYVTNSAGVPDTTSGSGTGLIYGQSVLHHHHRSSRSIHLKNSPNGAAALLPQNFIRASTIKLLDTYQRCGQKVRTLSNYFLI